MMLSETVTLTARQRRGPVQSQVEWLGVPLAVHVLGPYAVIEYQSSRPGNAPPDWKTERRFSGFVIEPGSKRTDANGWTSTSRSSATLESAIVDCIAYAAEGCNAQATRYFMRMIGHAEK